MQNIMVDLETLGTSADAIIVSIGAVKFDTDGTPLGERFYVTLDLDSQRQAGRSWTGKTLAWWMSQSQEARDVFLAKDRCTLSEALESFAQFFDHGDYKVWGNGSEFDNAILVHAYGQVGIEQPWGHRNNRCYRTLKNLHPEITMESWARIEHNALDDAMTQALHAQRLLYSGEPGMDFFEDRVEAMSSMQVEET